ncbi:hypothetical protein C8F04DRAFT_1191913 [Mycena alexandri]|uniref:Uncharacterized protein n=1 Tax=Mycena alexandri TaxID=1745969 RepID=A0AAD6WXN6_9AGAR|nr:hypothetical protein C8F04DRAFT_1191913 [Mycena alexandri]
MKGKTREMFDAYNEDAVPAIMPFPEASQVVCSKGAEIAVPRLNKHQRSYLLDVALCDVDLASLSGKAAADFYDSIKSEALKAKAFQHEVQNGDRDEEARLPRLITAWKREKEKNQKTVTSKKSGKLQENGGDGSDAEDDEGGRKALLCGNRRAAQKLRVAPKMNGNAAPVGASAALVGVSAAPAAASAFSPASSPASAAAVTKLLGIVSRTGRDRFREDRHDEIEEFSRTLPDDINNGGKFVKAEAQLWAKEDPATWEALVAAEEVVWEERQKLIPAGFKHMMQKLHTLGNFRPFMATMLMSWLDTKGELQMEWAYRLSRAEATSEGINVRQRFNIQYRDLTRENANAMYAWAKPALQEYAVLQGSVDDEPIIFDMRLEAVNDATPNMLAQAVTTFLVASYKAAFGSEDIPWAAIASAPDDFYETVKFPDIVVSSTGLAGLKAPQWYPWASSLAAGVGEGSAGFFRKPAAVWGDDSPHGDATAEAASLKEEEEKREQTAKATAEAAEAAHLMEEKEKREQTAEAEAARLKEEEEREQAAKAMEAAEAARLEEEKEKEKREQMVKATVEAVRLKEEEEKRKKDGRKRKADDELVGEEEKKGRKKQKEDHPAGGVRAPRARKTPAQAEAECQEKRRQELIAIQERGGGPSWEYTSPVSSPVKPTGRRKGRLWKGPKIWLGYLTLLTPRVFGGTLRVLFTLFNAFEVEGEYGTMGVLWATLVDKPMLRAVYGVLCNLLVDKWVLCAVDRVLCNLLVDKWVLCAVYRVPHNLLVDKPMLHAVYRVLCDFWVDKPVLRVVYRAYGALLHDVIYPKESFWDRIGVLLFLEANWTTGEPTTVQ